MGINFLYNCSDKKAFIMLEKYVMIKKLLRRLNIRESSLNFKMTFNDGILEAKFIFHLRFTLQLNSRTLKSKLNNYVTHHESICHGP